MFREFKSVFIERHHRLRVAVRSTRVRVRFDGFPQTVDFVVSQQAKRGTKAHWIPLFSPPFLASLYAPPHCPQSLQRRPRFRANVQPHLISTTATMDVYISEEYVVRRRKEKAAVAAESGKTTGSGLRKEQQQQKERKSRASVVGIIESSSVFGGDGWGQEIVFNCFSA
ncbi:unnamed protein product [Musa banksii]